MKLRIVAAASLLAVGVVFYSEATAAIAVPDPFCDIPRPDCTKCLTFPSSGFTWGICVPPG